MCRKRVMRRNSTPLSLQAFVNIVAMAIAVAWPLTGYAQGLHWFIFNKNFIRAHYAADSAIGSVRALVWARAATIHPRSCGGKDGELHVGSMAYELDVPDDQRPVTQPEPFEDEAFGLTYELPNARDGDGPATLTMLMNRPVTFRGFWWVWNEGHDVGPTHPSNPHHVLELHPSWTFTSESTTFDRPDLVSRIPGFRGYSGSQFRLLARSIQNDQWPRLYQTGNELAVAMAQFHNFYQIPVIVRAVTTITSGHELTLDVFSSRTYATRIYRDLRAITVDGSPIDGTLAVDARTVLVGILSVNLRRGLSAVPASATSRATAVHLPEVVEFFVFGRASGAGLVTCDP
jgi:hypothetical protein